MLGSILAWLRPMDGENRQGREVDPDLPVCWGDTVLPMRAWYSQRGPTMQMLVLCWSPMYPLKRFLS